MSGVLAEGGVEFGGDEDDSAAQWLHQAGHTSVCFFFVDRRGAQPAEEHGEHETSVAV